MLEVLGVTIVTNLALMAIAGVVIGIGGFIIYKLEVWANGSSNISLKEKGNK